MTRTPIKALVASLLSVGALTSHASSIYAPFVDMGAYPTPLIDQIGVQQGIQQFELGFVVADATNGCVPSWGGLSALDIVAGNTQDQMVAISTGITQYRAKGGEVSVSFGGENGTPLMTACKDVPSLQRAYQTVIDTYGLTHIDFDIEGNAQEDQAGLTRNFQAVSNLQKAMAAKNKLLHVTLTLPTLQSGLTQDGINIVETAIRNQVDFDAVNVMAMNYGPAVSDMGKAAIQAAQSLYSQLDTAYKSWGAPMSSEQLWQMVGVTPMIGTNYSAGETFTTLDTQNLAAAARTNGYGMLSDWSLNRDQSCPGGSTAVSTSCSGVQQVPYEFAGMFLKQFGDHWGTGVKKDPNYGGGGGDGSWSPSQVYTNPMTVKYQGATYEAQWWTKGDVPGQSPVWKQLDGPTPTWSPTAAYSGKDYVMYQGAEYQAKWWTQGEVPSAGGVWVKQ
ncbi:chitinase [Trinickia fusca]|uniref:Chitinase n=1 Tax=Trinickia fusca TaxID=2419777 RepID=A0A494XBE3_9BURK|nr:chitinase [Trinickia fusca]RKP48147.1 chitinase [Trinickia fusca]